MTTQDANSKPRKPRRQQAGKATREEKDLRVKLAIEMLSRNMYHGEIKRALAAKFGIAPRTVEKYLRRARNEIAAAVSVSIPDMRALQAERYRRLLDQHPGARLGEKVRCLERLDKLFGLEAPVQTPHTSDDFQHRADIRSLVDALTASPEIVEFYRQQAAKDDAQICDTPRDSTTDPPENDE